MRDQHAAAAVAADRIAELLCADAVWAEGRALWFGDEVVTSAPGSTPATVYKSLAGDLYGGSAGIALFLARHAAIRGSQESARTAAGGLRHALWWAERTRPTPALHAGWCGVAAATMEAGLLLDDERLLEQAVQATRRTVTSSSDGADLISGHAGTLLGLLYLERALGPVEGATAAAAAHTVDTLGEALLAEARPGPVGGLCWSGPEPEGTPLCGLGHGASGIALALGEWAVCHRRPDALEAAGLALDFERGWFSSARNNWPDLRGTGVTPDPGPAWPAYWCHGAVGAGVARLRLYELTGSPIYAAEAGAALEATVDSVAELATSVSDLSVCHGLAGPVEFLLDAARAFGQPELVETAALAGEMVLRCGASGHWPCGVPGGEHNPSLFLGLAGIGTTLLRLSDARTTSTVRSYAGGAVAQRVVVTLTAQSAGRLQECVEALSAAVTGVVVDRISGQGRASLWLPLDIDPEAGLRLLGTVDGVARVEREPFDQQLGGPIDG